MKENRGGARPNSGPKPFSLSASQVKELLRTVKKFAKEHRKSIDDVLVEMVANRGFNGGEFCSAIPQNAEM